MYELYDNNRGEGEEGCKGDGGRYERGEGEGRLYRGADWWGGRTLGRALFVAASVNNVQCRYVCSASAVLYRCRWFSRLHAPLQVVHRSSRRQKAPVAKGDRFWIRVG